MKHAQTPAPIGLLGCSMQQLIHHPRVKRQLTTGDGCFSVHVLDLSLKGALVVLSPGVDLQPGALCQLVVPLTSTHDHIAMSTEVAHVEGRCAGLLCHSIDLDSVTHLRRLIELQLGAPHLLDRDLAELTTT